MARKHNRQWELKRETKKAAKRRQRIHPEGAKASSSFGAGRGLGEAERLLAGGKYGQAIDLLEELARRRPSDDQVLANLAQAYLAAGDLGSYQATCERLIVAEPNEPVLWLALASAAVRNSQPATAHRAFSHVVAKWPSHPEAAEARDMQTSLRTFLEIECRSRGLEEEIGFRVLLLHDEVNLHLNRGKYDKTCDAATRLLAICPTFAPALNNRSEAHFRSARYDQAIADSRRVLEFDAANYHALANLARYLYLTGRFDEAQTAAAALKACDANDGEATTKKAETFAVLGDWEAILQIVQDAESACSEEGALSPLVEHLAGVALANLGDLKGARVHWRRAADFAFAKENLKDSQREVGKRHGPWAFPFENWLPRASLEELVQAVAEARQDCDTARIVERHFERHPQLELLADALLERSDAAACEMLIRLAPMVKRPALFASLKKFALGERGSDELRMEALAALSQAGYVEGQVEIWREGALHPVGLASQEIYTEPAIDLPPELNDLMLAAHRAINENRGAEAERQLDKFLRLRPDDLSAQFNRAIAITLQGRNAEALSIVRQMHRDHPEYVFARTHLADDCISRGRLEEAKTLLAPIAQKTRLHVTEYFAWCSANIHLATAKGDLETARKLLAAWEQIDPDNRQMKIWKGRLRGVRGVRGVRGTLGRLHRFFDKASK